MARGHGVREIRGQVRPVQAIKAFTCLVLDRGLSEAREYRVK